MKKKILIVDDEEEWREAERAVLDTRYDVRTASSARQALEAIDADMPDVVILDVMMNYLSEGFDLCHQIKGDPELSHVKVVMLTGVDQVYNIRQEVSETWMRCDKYLEKPVDPARLLATIEELLAP